MTTSPQTQPRPINNPNFATGPQERLELATWTPHILRLSRNPDSKIALFTTEPEHFQLRAELIQKHIDLHEFVIEHLEEQYQYE